MIESPFIVLEDATRDLATGVEIYEGQPVSLNSSGKVIPATAGTIVYGVSKLDANQYRNFAFGEYGAFGTGKLTVQCKGIVRVKASIFNKIEVDTSTTVASPVTVNLYDTTKHYVPGQALYVDGTGLISNTPTDKTSLLGRVVAAPADNSGDWLEFELVAGVLGDEITAQA